MFVMLPYLDACVIGRMPVFLFNYTDRKMHGIFRAVTRGDYEINPEGGRNIQALLD